MGGTPQRTALVRLSTAYALAWMSVAMVAGPGSAAYVQLSGRIEDAGFFIAIYFLAAAVGGAVGGRLMDSYGRRPALVASYLAAAAGFAGAGAAVLWGSLALFVAGVALLALGAGCIYLTRAAVAEMYPPQTRGRAVATLQFAVTGGALAGPLVLLFSGPLGDALGRDPMGLIWLAAPPLLIAGALLVLFSPETRELAYRDAPKAVSDGPIVPPPSIRPAILTGGAAIAFSQAAMIMAMGVTGAALTAQGHGLEVIGLVMAVHFLGMFGLSRQVGSVLDRFGRRTTILAGAGLMALGGVFLASLTGTVAFALALFTVGLGWSFGFTGGTVLVSDVAPAGRTGRTFGAIDMVTALLAVGASLFGGWWYARAGGQGLGLMTIALVIVPLIMALLLKVPSETFREPGRASPVAQKK